MIKKLQYYISDGTNPYENLAIEKILMDNLEEGSFILYLWQNEHTVVIGRNQNPWAECRCELLNEEGGRLARRLSGGGAVYHDTGNLNFTFIGFKDDIDISRQNLVIQEACRLSSVETEISGRNDILADGRKFSGNAFFNTKEKAYHHGTILISTDVTRMARYLTPPKAKIESKGIKSVRSRVVNLSQLSENITPEIMKEHMLRAFESVYGLTPTSVEIPKNEEFSRLSEKYASHEYLYESHFPFTASCENRFEWGSISILFRIKKGKIDSLKVYTDSMDWAFSDVLEKTLSGCIFDKASVKKALAGVFPSDYEKDIMGTIEKII